MAALPPTRRAKISASPQTGIGARTAGGPGATRPQPGAGAEGCNSAPPKFTDVSTAKPMSASAQTEVGRDGK